MSEAVGDDCDRHHDYDRRDDDDYCHRKDDDDYHRREDDDDNIDDDDDGPRASTHGDAVARRARRIGTFAPFLFAN